MGLQPFLSLNWEEPVGGARFFLQLRLSLATGLQERQADAKERFIDSAGTLRWLGIEIAPESARTHARGPTHAVSDGAQFVERLDVEPGALVSGRVQHHPHGVLLQQSGKTLVHRQVLVALQVQQLGHTGERFTSSFMKPVGLQLLCEGVSEKHASSPWRQKLNLY